MTSCSAVVVGAGPAGLASAACLKRRGIDPVVLESGPDLGHSWRNHYRRLHLHTVKAHSSLPGLPFPSRVPRYPSRDDVVAYLEAYAAHFGITPHTGETVRRITKAGSNLIVEISRDTYSAPIVIVATGLNRAANAEQLPDQSLFKGAAVHASRYVDGLPYAGQRVLVVGAGNTGAEIALDLAEHGATPTLSVRSPVNVVRRDFFGMPAQVTAIRTRWLPIAVADRIGSWLSRLAFGDLTRYGFPRPTMGAVSSIVLRGRIPIMDVGTIDAIKHGRIAVKPGVARLTKDGAVFTDGTATPFDAVIMATGYRPGLAGLVDIPGVLRDDGSPKDWQGGGVCPGLYFVGYESPPTGLIREIARRAEAVAADATRAAVPT